MTFGEAAGRRSRHKTAVHHRHRIVFNLSSQVLHALLLVGTAITVLEIATEARRDKQAGRALALRSASPSPGEARRSPVAKRARPAEDLGGRDGAALPEALEVAKVELKLIYPIRI